MQTGSCAAVDIVDKKNLPAGNYEEQDSFIVGDCRTDNGTGGCLSDIKQTSY
ncbi:MAG: hypothetical protein KH296_12620 [Ruminococcus sp.]|nr:hypothetical protein [Ruminococcus sp.]